MFWSKITRTALAGVTIMALSGVGPLQAAETITYKYDAKGRVVKVERSGTINNGVQTQYTHDKANNRKSVTTSGSTNPAP